MGVWTRTAVGHASCRRWTAVHIPRSQVGEGAVALVLVLHPQGTPRRWWQRGMATSQGLDRRHLVGGDDVLVATQLGARKAAGVEVEHAPRLRLEGRIAREDPAAVRPGTNRILGEPAPDGGPRDLRHDAAADHLPTDRSASSPSSPSG